MKNRQVTATEFKAKCLALLDEVNEQREDLSPSPSAGVR